MNLLGYTLTQEDMIVAAVGFSAFLAIVFVWRALLEPKPASDRMKDLKQRREALKEGLLNSAATSRGDVKRSSMGVMRKFVERLDLMRGDVAKETSAKLARAGLRTKDAMVAYLFFKLALPFISGAVGLIVINIFAPENVVYVQRILLALIVAVSAFFLPDLYINNLTKKRQKDLQKGLPDALDLLVVYSPPYGESLNYS